MSNWQDNRRQAHREGRHSRPQVDCSLCWDAGAFPDIEKLRDEERGILADPIETPVEEIDPYVDDGNPDGNWMSHK